MAHNHPIADDASLLHRKVMALRTDEAVDFDEAAGVDERLDPLARRQSSSSALLGVPCLTAAHQRHAVQFVESIHSEPFLARSRYDFLTIDLTPRFGCVDPTAIR